MQRFTVQASRSLFLTIRTRPGGTRFTPSLPNQPLPSHCITLTNKDRLLYSRRLFSELPPFYHARAISRRGMTKAPRSGDTMLIGRLASSITSRFRSRSGEKAQTQSREEAQTAVRLTFSIQSLSVLYTSLSPESLPLSVRITIPFLCLGSLFFLLSYTVFSQSLLTLSPVCVCGCGCG